MFFLVKGFEHAQEVPFEVRESAVRMTLDRLGDYESVSAAVKALAPKLNAGVETLRKWSSSADRRRCESWPKLCGGVKALTVNRPGFSLDPPVAFEVSAAR